MLPFQAKAPVQTELKCLEALDRVGLETLKALGVAEGTT